MGRSKSGLFLYFLEKISTILLLGSIFSRKYVSVFTKYILIIHRCGIDIKQVWRVFCFLVPKFPASVKQVVDKKSRFIDSVKAFSDCFVVRRERELSYIHAYQKYNDIPMLLTFLSRFEDIPSHLCTLEPGQKRKNKSWYETYSYVTSMVWTEVKIIIFAIRKY